MSLVSDRHGRHGSRAGGWRHRPGCSHGNARILGGWRSPDGRWHGAPLPDFAGGGQRCCRAGLAGNIADRLWRDSGYAFGALTIGVVADTFGLLAGFWFAAAIMTVSGLLVAILMYETLPGRPWRIMTGRRICAFSNQIARLSREQAR